ncbi:site-specific integrase [Luteibacter anthropi]|uniref:site-specific integrase n=1 Tax=Luteibacter anthropi TaxID=564369 RepID=UPI0020329908|nr:site-specific integrase [Luteibacter anthropi]URX62064.1 site-specific integrase [Luteibacter anthropi]
MRIPHYLIKAPSGVFHFRRRLPVALARLLGRAVIKKSLQTRDMERARDLALNLWRAYDELYAHVRMQGMAGDEWDIDALAAALKKKGKRYRLKANPDGSFEVEANGPEDHAHAKDMVASIGDMRKEAIVQQWIREQGFFIDGPGPAGPSLERSLPAATPAALSAAMVPAVTEPQAVMRIDRAIDEYIANIKSQTIPKTLTIKRLAITEFGKARGLRRPVHESTRVEIGKWVSHLREQNLATPTIVNKLSYVKTFLEWAKGKGYIEFPRNDNPASGHVSYKAREKRLRKKHGFKAFNDAQLKLLFAPSTIKRLSGEARLGTWMGLFMGARVSEVGQLALDDFMEVEGIPCVRITDEGEGQSTKNDFSNRVIPVHPELIRMGLLKRVERLRAKGETQLFPKVKGQQNGMGDWLSKAFGRYVGLVLPKPDMGKIGFHSFRKTVIQTLQAAGVTAELRAAYVGHELDDEHHSSYGMDAPKQQVLAAIIKLDYPVTSDADAFA